MKVRDQSVYHFKSVTGVDKNICPSASGFQYSIIICRRFNVRQLVVPTTEITRWPEALVSLISFCLIFLHDVKLRVHMVVCHVFHLDRPEGCQVPRGRYMCNPTPFCITFSRSSCVKCSPRSAQPRTIVLHRLSGICFCPAAICIYGGGGISLNASRISSKIPVAVNWIRRFPSSTISGLRLSKRRRRR